jgi:NAD(P)-dependent dehydrogenase (short-subunit alcohol dehydrogenase family)
MTGDLRGAFAIVTGAAQGLGAAIATAYGQAGMMLALMDVQAEKLAALAADLNRAGGDCTAFPVDLASAEATTTAVTQAIARYGAPRVLVHNAAILKVMPLMDVTFEEWTRVVNTALQAGFLLSHAVWPHMAGAGVGSIVYVSSRSGVEGFDGESAYCASKHGLEGLMKALAIEGKAVNIAVNTITPGMAMHTPMSERNYTDDLKQKWIDPIRLTSAFLTLACQDASGITGQRCNAWEMSKQATP